MGCDIHLAVEVRKNGVWERRLPPPEARDPWYVKQAAERDADKWAKKRSEVEWYHDRNYEVFAILAGVRNYNNVTPISEPRGLPDDVSPEVARLNYDHPEYDEDGDDVSLGDHSHSWLTLAELLAYPWGTEVEEEGWITFAQFARRHDAGETGRPNEWCRDVGGAEKLSRWEAESRLSLTRSALGGAVKRTYVLDRWTFTAGAGAGAFTTRVLPALQALAAREGVGHEDVRIVFGFDS